MTAYDEIRAMLAEDGSRPFVTMHDLRTGERAELSVVTAMNAMAKTANLLVDELGLGPGDVARVDLGLHWQAVGIIGGCWAAGLAVEAEVAGATAGGSSRESSRAAVAFIGQDRLERAADLTGTVDEVFAVSLAPFGMPIRDPLPAGVADLTTAVRVHGDRYAGPHPGDADPAISGAEALTHAGVLDRGGALAREVGLTAGGRCLIEEGALTAEGVPVPVWLAAVGLPAAIRGSVVLVRSDADSTVTASGVSDALITQERPDAVLLRR